MTFLAAEGEGFHVPTLDELFRYEPFWFAEDWTFFGLFDIGFNRVAMLTFLAGAIVIALMVAAFRQPKLVPGKFQTAMESLVGFVRESIVLEVIGPAGLKFLPFLTTVFLFIWVNNFFKVTPFVVFPTTGRMGLPAFLALVVWTIFILVGMKEQGALKYFRNVAVPSGVPPLILPLVIVIEVVSTFVVRPLTLAVRLFANMMAGHILIALTTIAVNAFLFDVVTRRFGDLAGLPIGLVLLAASPLVFVFEAMVATLQAYIFTILAAVYISGSLHPEH